MTRKEDFLQEKLGKAVGTLKGISTLITQSFEIESMTKNSESALAMRLNRIGVGTASNKAINDGNGWNCDTHVDGSLTYSSSDNGGCYGTETSSSPLNSVGYVDMKAELTNLIEIYKLASGGVYHTDRGSCHVHNTISYTNDDWQRISVTKDIAQLVPKMYVNVAKFMLKFMPVLKWLSMTAYNGARGVDGSSYDKLERDLLFKWYRDYKDNLSSLDSFNYIKGMERSSYLRIYRSDVVHFENRMLDCTFSPTHLAMWLSINKAMTLWAYEFAIKGYNFNINDEDYERSVNQMENHRMGFSYVNRNAITRLYKEMLSYLTKYLKILGSLDAINAMDKLIECPVSQYLQDNSIRDTYYNTDVIEKVFNTRNRTGDVALRERYMEAIKTMAVPYADNLNEFHEKVGWFLGIETSKAKSLYQMFNRENVEIEFLGGRLVYMGD